MIDVHSTDKTEVVKNILNAFKIKITSKVF